MISPIPSINLKFICISSGKKETTGNVKSVNKPSATSPLAAEKSVIKEQVERKTDDCHQKIVKRLMSHSQYYPSSNVYKVETSSAAPATTLPPYQQTPYTISHYPSYNYNHYNNNNSNDLGDFYHQKEFNYQTQQPQYQPPPYSSLSITPPLASPTIINNFDQLSNCSPPSSSSDYIFNGDFNIFNTSDFDISFPFIDSATNTATKSTQLFDNQTVEIKQLTPIKIQSLDDEEEEKKSNSGSFELANVDDHHTIPALLPSVASVNCWKFSEPQMTASYWEKIFLFFLLFF